MARNICEFMDRKEPPSEARAPLSETPAGQEAYRQEQEEMQKRGILSSLTALVPTAPSGRTLDKARPKSKQKDAPADAYVSERRLGAKVQRFRILASYELLEAHLGADAMGSDSAHALEFKHQILARSLVTLDGEAMPEWDPEALMGPNAVFGEGLDEEARQQHKFGLLKRLAVVRMIPEPLIDLLMEHYESVRQEYRAFVLGKPTPLVVKES